MSYTVSGITVIRLKLTPNGTDTGLAIPLLCCAKTALTPTCTRTRTRSDMLFILLRGSIINLGLYHCLLLIQGELILLGRDRVHRQVKGLLRCLTMHFILRPASRALALHPSGGYCTFKTGSTNHGD
mmetsp:Transcript_53716/g.156591  ORF Transcript_53716/g.156591 Transcript_53716/m.156591 type:complete len:127 (-) Transcript_53716:78-458(-)